MWISKLSVLIFIIFILRLDFASKWLEDWDSVQFALGLHEFSLIKHQPHPPGYPLYIILGQASNLFWHNDTLALESLSILAGTLAAVICFYFSRRTLVAILVGFTPIAWLLSEVALSNIVGLCFTCLTSFILYKGRSSLRMLLLGSFLAGITIGVRFAEFTIVISLLITVLVVRRSGKEIILSIFYFLFGIAMWLIPLIYLTGFGNFINLYNHQVSYIINHDSTSQNRIGQIISLISIAYSPAFLILAGLSLFQIFKLERNFRLLWISVWLGSYLVPLVFVYNLEVTRHVLPLLPPLAIFVGLTMARHRLVNAVLLTLLLIMATDQVARQYQTIPPSIAPVLYVQSHFDKNETELATSFIYRQFQYYAPEYQTSYEPKHLVPNHRFVITDRQGLKDKIDLKNYNLVATREFVGPKDIFPRLAKTNLYIYEKID